MSGESRPNLEPRDASAITKAIGISALATAVLVPYALTRETGAAVWSTTREKVGRSASNLAGNIIDYTAGKIDGFFAFVDQGLPVMPEGYTKTPHSTHTADVGTPPGGANASYDGRNW